MRRHLIVLLATFLAVLPGMRPSPAWAQDVTVMAAASLIDAMKELGAAWAAKGHPAPRFSFGASSALARQIEQGAPADIFAFADEPWADYLQQRNLLVPGTRISPLGNALVLIAPADQPGSIAIAGRGAAGQCLCHRCRGLEGRADRRHVSGELAPAGQLPLRAAEAR